MRRKQGISLLVLIITMVVIIIIGTAIVVTIAKTNIINNANKAVFKQDIAVVQDMYNMQVFNIITESKEIPAIYTDETYTQKVVDKVQINTERPEIGKVYYKTSKEKGCIIFGKQGQAKEKQMLEIASTDEVNIEEIMYKYTNQELPTYKKQEVKWYITASNSIQLESNGIIYEDEDKDEENKEENEPVKEWLTYNTEYYNVDAGSESEWVNVEKDEVTSAESRMIYSYSKSNDNVTYTDYTEDISANGNSRYLKIKVDYQKYGIDSNSEAKLNDMVIEYNVNGVKNYKSVNETKGLVEILENANIQNDSYCTIHTNNKSYTIHAYVYEGDQVWDSMTFGNANDVGASGKYAQNMVVVKVNGNLTINEGAIVTAYNTTYGGPKGMTMICSGTITNNGTISMTARGAYAPGEDVYLWKNTDGTYEYVPAAGAGGGAQRKYTTNTTLSDGKYVAGDNGKNGTGRKTAGGGSGSVYIRSYYTTAISGAGAAGTSYSGGTGGGCINVNYDGTKQAGSGASNGGAGGNAYAHRQDSSYAVRNGGGGAGNPGGKSMTNGTSNTTYKGEDGTGGLLVMYTNTLINNGKIESNGSKGGNALNYGGGSSGGGSINIFYKLEYTNNNEVNSNGGESVGNTNVTSGGAGGTGSISVGNISTGSYVSTYKNY